MFCQIDCSVHDLSDFLEAVNKEITRRVKLEDFEKQRRIIFKRMESLTRKMSELFYEDGELCLFDVNSFKRITNEILKLKAEFSQLTKDMQFSEYYTYYRPNTVKMFGMEKRPFFYSPIS